MHDDQQQSAGTGKIDGLEGLNEILESSEVNEMEYSNYVAGRGEMAKFSAGPGRVTAIVAPTGFGKTGVGMQATCDFVRLNPEKRACVCHVETARSVLVAEQKSRLSGVTATKILSNTCGAVEIKRVEQAGQKLAEEIGNRLQFCKPPFEIERVLDLARQSQADWLYVDYVQEMRAPARFACATDAVAANMRLLREFALEGRAVVVAAAINRTVNTTDLKSLDDDACLRLFRDSSAIEFTAASAYLLVSDESTGLAELRHIKERHGPKRDIQLQFHRNTHAFVDRKAA
jgi:replicative DNA helicase